LADLGSGPSSHTIEANGWRKAFDLTLIHALDVEDYHAALLFLAKDKSDEEILVSLHE
jgi:hypothetical protein